MENRRWRIFERREDDKNSTIKPSISPKKMSSSVHWHIRISTVWGTTLLFPVWIIVNDMLNILTIQVPIPSITYRFKSPKHQQLNLQDSKLQKVLYLLWLWLYEGRNLWSRSRKTPSPNLQNEYQDRDCHAWKFMRFNMFLIIWINLVGMKMMIKSAKLNI